MFKTFKIILILTWVGLTVAAVLPISPVITTYCLYGLLVMAGVHALEFIFYVPVFKKEGSSMTNHFLMTLLFGLFHFFEVKNSMEENTN